MGDPREDRGPSARGHPPLRLLVAVACALTAALFVPLAWHILHSFRTCQTITESYMAGEERRDAIYHANAELILAARAAVLDSLPRDDAARAAAASHVRRLIAEARTLRPRCRDRCHLTDADSLQAELRGVEAAAVVLARIGRRSEAVALLTSPGYAAIHDAFHGALDDYAAHFKEQVQRSIEFERGEELGIVGVSGGILLASIVVWVLLVRILERWRLGLQRESREREIAEKRAEAALRRFRRLFHHALDAIYLVDAGSGRILDANRAACAQTGYSRRELGNLRLADLDAEPGASPAWQHRAPQGGVVERTQRRRDGTTFPVEVGARLIDEATGPVQLCVVRDVAERKAFEAQLGRAQKMECVGRLAAGIAHDFGNILLAVSGFALVGRRGVPADHPAAGAFARIETAAGQATGLARSLLHFANRPAGQVRPVELRALVGGTLALLDPSLPASVVKDDSRLDGPELWVEADPHRLQQAVLNLCLNARDAMPDGGRLAVAVTAARERRGAVARVSVADTGCGIPAAVRQRLGEPFFSTKGEDGGCGLGLFNVQTIMNECGGRLEIDSVAGAGSTFTLVLPARAAPARDVPVPEGPALPAAAATVLLALSGELLRGLAADALQALGCRVRAVPDAAALAAALAGEDCDVVVLDADLPDGGAAAALDLLPRLRTEARLVLVAGERPLPAPPGAVTLVKPYTMPELGDAVRRAAAGARCRQGEA